MSTSVWPTVTSLVSGGAGAAGTAQAAANTFVPKIWSDELLIQREVNLVAAKFFKRINHKGKKGDTIVVPFISDLTAQDKVAGTAVTIEVLAEGSISITLDKHKYVSQLFDDFFMAQQRYDLRSAYNDKAGYAIAKALDTDIFALFAAGLPTAYKVVGADGITAWASAGAGNASSLSDAGFRRAIQTLDDNLAPEDGRALFIPPSQKNALLGIDKFTLFQNIGRTKELQTGQFGEIYGIPVYVSTNLPTWTAGDTTTTGKIAILAHKDAVCSAIQMDVRTQAQNKAEHLGTLVVSDIIYGVKGLRLDADDTTGSNHRKSQAVALYVPA
jgi:N4-gp56 family major capsid protein